jgi:HlyD family secretion protein
VKVSPPDIDQISAGQKVILRLSAFNQRNTPELDGIVTNVAADLAADQRTGLNYYVVRAKVLDGQWERLGDLKPVPGMPVEAFFQTGERTVLSYLAKPFTDQVRRAFREE